MATGGASHRPKARDEYEDHDETVHGLPCLRLRSTGRELWRWTQMGIFQPTHGPHGGVADTLEQGGVPGCVVAGLHAPAG
jgi:hypothetical protein